MVSATISVVVLAGILSAFLMIGRTGYAAGNYSEMDAQTRRALDIFGADARKAADVRWHDAQTLTLQVSTAGAGTTAITYGYDNLTSSPTYRSFYRLNGDVSSSTPRLALVRNVTPDFAFARFKLEQPGVSDNTATNDLETKQVQVTLRTARAGATTPMATQSAVSARYILRNKRVSN
ncbi:MAG: hypothetical protein JNK23_19860 [Opitutaceae bacterium]|nr:hypothetical protein [Opitutaceae bacterium]